MRKIGPKTFALRQTAMPTISKFSREPSCLAPQAGYDKEVPPLRGIAMDLSSPQSVDYPHPAIRWAGQVLQRQRSPAAVPDKPVEPVTPQ